MVNNGPASAPQMSSILVVLSIVGLLDMMQRFRGLVSGSDPRRDEHGKRGNDQNRDGTTNNASRKHTDPSRIAQIIRRRHEK